MFVEESGCEVYYPSEKEIREETAKFQVKWNLNEKYIRQTQMFTDGKQILGLIRVLEKPISHIKHIKLSDTMISRDWLIAEGVV